MYVVTRKFSRYAEHSTGTQLDEVLDPTSGCYIAVAKFADDDEARKAAFEKLDGFDVMSDEDYASLIARKEAPVRLNQAATGDALTDEAHREYYIDELEAMDMKALRPIAKHHGVSVANGVTKLLMIRGILEAQSDPTRVASSAGESGAGESGVTVLDGPPAPPSSGGA